MSLTVETGLYSCLRNLCFNQSVHPRLLAAAPVAPKPPPKYPYGRFTEEQQKRLKCDEYGYPLSKPAYPAKVPEPTAGATSAAEPAREEGASQESDRAANIPELDILPALMRPLVGPTVVDMFDDVRESMRA